LTALRASPTPVKYLVGTPRAQVRQTRAQWEALPWTTVRDTVAVKLFQQAGELYVVARSDGRQQKEIAIRRQKLARRLRTLRGLRQETQRDRLLMRWGAAKAKAGRVASLVAVRWPEPHKEISPHDLHLCPAQRKTQRSRTRRRPLPLAQQTQRQRTGVAVATLHAPGADRRGVPLLQE
jgi:hypothetical protein